MNKTAEMPRQQPNTRRTQQERRSSTQQQILEATLDCIEEFGYASTSITLITERANVSRGALVHHFPSKVNLIAHAIAYLYRRRSGYFQQLFEEVGKGGLSIRDRLLTFRQKLERWFPVILETMVALRTDPELHAEYQRLSPSRKIDPPDFKLLLPEATDQGNSEMLAYVTTYFLRGWCLEASQQGKRLPILDEIFDQYVQMVELAVNAKNTAE